MQQLRLFPRDQRLPVVMIDDGSDGARAVLRRLRRCRRLDVRVLGGDPLDPGVVDLPADLAAGGIPVAVIAHHDGTAADLDRLRAILGASGGAPLIVVAPSDPDAILAAVEAGAEDVVAVEDATGARMERAVLTAMSRRSSDLRERGREADPLTGLATRATLERELPSMLAAGGGVAVLYCDLDRFKPINDTHGHAVGDEVLRDAARRLGRAVRASDLVVRVGGDEFVVVVNAGPNVDTLAHEVADRIVRAFSTPFVVGELRLTVTASVGLAVHRGDEGPEEFVARADRALYLAKGRGKARVAHYDDQMDRAAANLATVAATLQEGLRRDLLSIDVHPVVDGHGARVVGHVHRPAWGSAPEALGRSEPTARISEVAEANGRGAQLFRYTLEAIVHDCEEPHLLTAGSRRWIEMPRSVLLGSPGAAVEPVAASTVLTPDQLVVVINEADLTDSAALRTSLLELARRGVRVAVGRFGATEGSLGLLERHPFEAVWLDRQMVDGVAECSIRRAKVAAVLHVAAAIGLQVLVDRPTHAADARMMAGTEQVLVVDGALDLTGGVVLPRPAGERRRRAAGAAVGATRRRG